jgi:glycosyltransferase involved in cell wall biosynthesis
MAGLVRKAGMGASTLRIVPNGIPDRPLPSTTPEQGSHMLYLGRLSREKGVDQLCAAASLVPDIPILVAGDGPIRETLEATAPANVRFLGACSQDELAAHLAAAVAVVSPSTWYENAPLSVLEAMRAARPVIATALGGLPELVDAGVGRLVTPMDPAAIGAALRELWDDRILARSLGDAGRRRYLDHHTHDEHMRALQAVYAEVVPTSSTGLASSVISPDASR